MVIMITSNLIGPFLRQGDVYGRAKRKTAKICFISYLTD